MNMIKIVCERRIKKNMKNMDFNFACHTIRVVVQKKEKRDSKI